VLAFFKYELAHTNSLSSFLLTRFASLYLPLHRYSLPRWVWIDRTRESIIAGAIPRDERVIVRQRMFPLPLSAPYHPAEPDPSNPSKWRDATGYDSAATLSPLEDHVNEIEWALSTTFGTGAAPMIRGW